jgi:quinol monooxygenase YgiN
MIIAMTEFVPRANQREAMVEVLSFVSNRVTHTPGCLLSKIYQSFGESEEVLYVEQWNSEQSLGAYIQSVLYLRFLHAFELASKPPLISFYTVSATRSLDLVEQLRSNLGNHRKRLH